MTNDIIYSNLIKAIKEKIPQRGKLTTTLVNLLFIEKEAIYRRLRGEVPFTFAEISTIAKELDISLDTIIGNNSPKSRPFHMKLVEFNNPTETDYEMVKEFVDLVRSIQSDPTSEYGCASSSLPLNFLVSHKYIFRFHLLKWMYQFGSPEAVKPYTEIHPADRLQELIDNFIQAAEQLKYSYYIWDKLTFMYLINDINYFHSIRLINREDMLLLKEEMMMFMDELEKIASDGHFKTGKKVQLFISSINFETNYSYLQATNLYLTLIRTFALNDTASLDREVFDKLKAWILSLKRTSTLISESGEMQRIRFFDEQRKIIDEHFIIR